MNNESQRHYEVVVVGAGPTGLTTANLLGRAGVRTLLIEVNPSTVNEPRAVSIDDESLRVIQRLGLLDELRVDLVPGYGSEYLGPDRTCFLRVEPQGQPYGHPKRNAFRQPFLEEQLRRGLSRFPSVEAQFSCRVESVTERPDGVILRTIDKEEKVQIITADYVVACDGARSGLRDQLGSRLDGSSLDERWLIIDLEDSPVESKQTIVFCNPSRPCIALPGPHASRRYEFKLLPGEREDQMLSDACVASLLAAHDAAPKSKIVRKTIYHFHARLADQWGRHRIWLAGDAAHLMPPFAGQGMNSGIRDAANISWKIAEVVRGRLGPLLLQSYEEERRDHVKSMIKLALRMGAIMGPSSRLHGLATRAFFRCLNIWPSARTYFAEMKYKPPPQFTNGFLVLGAQSAHGAVGRLLPQPPIADSTHGTIQLDDILEEGFVLLGVDVGADALAQTSLGPDWDQMLSQKLQLTSQEVPVFKRFRGKFLLLRPDRYIMASFQKGEEQNAVKALVLLRRQTWPMEDAR